MNIAVILAGGVGQRFGAEIPKQFVEVLGKPILAYTIEKFEKCDDVDAIEVVCVESSLDVLHEMVKKYNYSKVKWITSGGATFQESVQKGMNNLSQVCSDDDILLFHFGASPFIEEDIIVDAIKVCEKTDNCISTTSFFLLSGIKDDETKSSTWIDRDTIACMNSPHAFKFSYISELYKEAYATGIINEVEPHTTSLMQAMGRTIYFSKGSQLNIKITNREDTDLFEGYVLMKRSRGIDV